MSAWRGPTREYDLLKELVVALAVVGLLTTALAVLFSSPDEPAVSLQTWATADANDFVATATGELAGTTTSAGYGAPYNTASDGMSIGPVRLQKWAGVRIPVDPAQDFVVTPLSHVSGDAALTTALDAWRGAPADRRTAWAGAYAEALTAAGGDPAAVDAAKAADYGPVPELTGALLGLAHTGVLDSDLVGSAGFFQTDYTRPLLFLADGEYLASLADAQHLEGEQWGMMNETGSYPGQAWLWLYTFWYQVPPFTTAWADNADVIVWALMMLLSVLLVLVPFIPGVRSLPMRIPVYRLVWRQWYADQSQADDAAREQQMVP